VARRSIPYKMMFGLSGIAALVGVYFLAERMEFIEHSATAVGMVRTVEGHDANCGKGNNKCTRFNALVDFDADGLHRELWIPAGKAKGYGQPVTQAELKATDAVEIIYRRDDPSEAYRDDFKTLWRDALFAFGVGALFGLVGLLGFVQRDRAGAAPRV